MKITPDLIPHHQFHEGSWLLPVKRPYWYYFKKGKNSNRISDKKFLQGVDAPLKPLVKYLHSKGIKTTPSCSGHRFNEKRFEKIYSSLKSDKKEICSTGLLLKDCETGRIYTYRNKNYQLPWTKKVFVNKLISYQHSGIIGIKLRNRALEKEILKLKIRGVKIKEQNFILFIYTKSKNGRNSGKWKKVTRGLKQILDRKI